MSMDAPTDQPSDQPSGPPPEAPPPQSASEHGADSSAEPAEDGGPGLVPAGRASSPGQDSGSIQPDAEAATSDPASHRFECRSCGFVYDPGEGIKKLAIPQGTPFSDLDPIGFRCPVCRSRVGAFKDIGPRNKPSGFEENLNFGLGVNRLTPGQKNVLIFGGFALAIAFFLSLYSLR